MNLDYFSAFIIGLLGSGHCLVMCGGITTMLTSAISERPSSPKFRLIVSYHIGRIFSYSLIGAIVGFSGAMAAKNIGVPLVALRMVAAIFLVLLGLYLGQWLMWLTRIEMIGRLLWKKISPISKRFIPVNSPYHAMGLGVLWGWLPCGLVYSTLTWAMASGSAISGALIMAYFGLGTLPALVSLSLGVLNIKTLLTNPLFRKFMAVGIIIYGLYSISVAYQLMF